MEKSTSSVAVGGLTDKRQIKRYVATQIIMCCGPSGYLLYLLQAAAFFQKNGKFSYRHYVKSSPMAPANRNR